MSSSDRARTARPAVSGEQQLLFGAEVSARPSDSIALALRTGAAIFATDEILDEAGVAIPDEQEDEVEKFREFLDQISPEDFGRSALVSTGSSCCYDTRSPW